MNLPSLIIFQVFHLFNHTLNKSCTASVNSQNRNVMTLPEEEFVKMSELIKAFIMNKDFFERGYLTSDENRV